MATRRHRVRRVAALGPLALLLAGCGNSQDTLAPRSHSARDIASLFWWMMGGAWIGLGLVVVLLVWAWRRQRRPGGTEIPADRKPGERRAVTVVVVMGIVVPIVVMVTIFIVSDLFVIGTTEAPAAGATRLTVDVIGHQWWWEIRYPGTDAVTANELHIPVDTPVRVDVSSVDVIHSFWVPQLNRTIDAIPGHPNSIELYADKVGRYRGECEEYCGLQHAHMAVFVFVDPPGAFGRWLAGQSRPAAAPAGGSARLGEQVFVDGPCQSCHAIRGTNARGNVGPDLTHIAARTTLGALTIPNDRASLGDWIVNSQHIKPGNEMPDINLTSTQLSELLDYLGGLH